MKKILVVGYVPYSYKDKLVKAHPNVLWFEERDIGMSDSAFALIELVSMMDAIMFMDKDCSDRLGYEVACAMTKKTIHEAEDFPVEIKEKEDANG